MILALSECRLGLSDAITVITRDEFLLGLLQVRRLGRRDKSGECHYHA